MNDTRNSDRRGLDHRIPPPLVFIATAAAMGAVLKILPPSDLGGTWSRVLGAGLLLLAALSGPPAIWRFGRAGTTINPVAVDRASALVTEGPYRWSRNPMYLAMAALLSALAAFAAEPWLLLGPAAFVLFITSFQIRPEERAMRARFGPAYDAYCRRVRRWL